MVKKKAEMAVCPQLVEIKFKNYKTTIQGFVACKRNYKTLSTRYCLINPVYTRIDVCLLELPYASVVGRNEIQVKMVSTKFDTQFLLLARPNYSRRKLRLELH